MLSKYISAILISTLFFSCGSVPLYQVIPVTEVNNYHYDQSIISVEDEDAKTILNYDAQAGGYFAFFVVIENKSDSYITIYPEDFYAEAFLKDDSLETTEPLRFYAFNPEHQLAAIDKDVNKLNSEKEFNDGLNCFLLGAVVVSDIASIAKENTEEEEDFKEMVFEKIDQDEINYEEKKYELEAEREHWEYEALRTTTLKPGEKMAGVFYLPIYENAKWFRAVIPVGEKEYVYNYKQVKK